MRTGICSWSIDRHDVLAALRQAAELGFSAAQVGFFTNEAARNADPAAMKREAKSAGVEIVGTFAAFEGEDYSSIAAVAASGGLMPDERFAARRAHAVRVGDIARGIGCTGVGMHIGTVPATAGSPGWGKLLERTQQVAEDLEGLGAALLIETGRESGATLAAFLKEVDRSNVRVCFDAANFVVYGTDEPQAALRELRAWIDVVHLKDATYAQARGAEFGQAAPLGAGDVGVPRLVSKLRALGSETPLLLEFGGGGADLNAIRSAKEYLESMIAA